MRMGHLWLNGLGIYHLMVGHLRIKWVGQSWQVAVSFGNMLVVLMSLTTVSLIWHVSITIL